MKQLQLKITAKSPLAIGERKPGSVSEAMDYIPGSVIRGAIAQKILQHGGSQQPEPGDDFHQLFVDDGAAIFRNAYPAIAKTGEDSYQESTNPICLLPATALSSKTESGFRSGNVGSGNVGSGKAGVFDALIDSFCAREHGLFYEPNDLKGNRVEPFAGFYSKGDNGYCIHSVSKRLLTRVGINRKRATAQDEILYSIEVLNESQGKGEKTTDSVYRGDVLVNDDALADRLGAFVRANGDRFRLGGSVSRGLGQVSLELKNPPSSESLPISDRITKFNQVLQERWSLWNALGQPELNNIQDHTFFTIDLQSDAILSERWKRTMVISSAMLCQWAGLPDDGIELQMAYSGYDYRSGWNAAWGLPKDMELITKMGSVFLFSVPKEQKNTWVKKLSGLEQEGVGDRTTEGFGHIRICDEFHQILWEEPA